MIIGHNAFALKGGANILLLIWLFTVKDAVTKEIQPAFAMDWEDAAKQQMMKIPGIEKAPYSRPNDGWVSIDPNVFDCWEEIERLISDSFRLIAPKRVSALLDE